MLRIPALRFQLAKRLILSFLATMCFLVHANQTENQDSINPKLISIDLILTLTSLSEQVSALSTAVKQLPEESVFELLDQIVTISQLDRRRAFLGTIFPRVTELNLRRTLETFRELPQKDRLHVVESIYMNISVDDEIDAVRASNDFPSNLQEKALLALLSARDLTFSRVLEFAKVAPLLVAPLVSELEGYTEQYDILGELIQHWARIDLQLTFDLIKNLHGTTLDDEFLIESMTSTAAIYPAESLQFTHGYFRDYGLVLESWVFDTIVEGAPDIAKELLPNLRRVYENTRLVYIEQTLLKLGPEYALEFGKTLPLDDSEWFFRLLDNEICKVEPQVFIDALDDIQAVESASKIAKCLLLEARLDDKLTPDQFESLYGKLLGQDLQSIDAYEKSNFIKGEAR